MKKIVAILLMILVVIGCVGCTKKGPRTLSPEVSEAYSKFLQKQHNLLTIQTDMKGTWKSQDGKYTYTFTSVNSKQGTVYGRGFFTTVKDGAQTPCSFTISSHYHIVITKDGEKEENYMFEFNDNKTAFTLTNEKLEKTVYTKL